MVLMWNELQQDSTKARENAFNAYKEQEGDPGEADAPGYSDALGGRPRSNCSSPGTCSSSFMYICTKINRINFKMWIFLGSDSFE